MRLRCRTGAERAPAWTWQAQFNQSIHHAHGHHHTHKHHLFLHGHHQIHGHRRLMGRCLTSCFPFNVVSSWVKRNPKHRARPRMCHTPLPVLLKGNLLTLAVLSQAKRRSGLWHLGSTPHFKNFGPSSAENEKPGCSASIYMDQGRNEPVKAFLAH